MLNKMQEAADKQKAAAQAASEQNAALYHRVFEQHPAGKQLFSQWVQRYSLTPVKNPQATMFELGIAEGKRQMVFEITMGIAHVVGQDAAKQVVEKAAAKPRYATGGSQRSDPRPPISKPPSKIIAQGKADKGKKKKVIAKAAKGGKKHEDRS